MYDPCNNCNKPYPCSCCEHNNAEPYFIDGYPRTIMCEQTMFSLGAIDENGDGYYLSINGDILRANDLYVPKGATMPRYTEYATNGLYFCYENGAIELYIKQMLNSKKCKVFTEQMRNFIDLKCKIYEFEDPVEIMQMSQEERLEALIQAYKVIADLRMENAQLTLNNYLLQKRGNEQ